MIYLRKETILMGNLYSLTLLVTVEWKENLSKYLHISNPYEKKISADTRHDIVYTQRLLLNTCRISVFKNNFKP
jgi:hypothetical protein